MKQKRSLIIIVCLIAVLAVLTALIGVLSNGGPGEYLFETITGMQVRIYGIGVYQTDSVGVAVQGIAQDFITLVMGVPLLIFSLILTLKNSFKGKLILTGTLGYFLYTYASYVFLWMYNPWFIVYVILMSLSLFGFIMMMMSYQLDQIENQFDAQLPKRFLGIYQIVIGVFIGMLWLGKIAPTILDGTTPEGLDHYTTLVIQGLDLGVVVPTAILSGVLLLKRRPMGYLLTSVVAVKGFTMLSAISAMVLNQALQGIQMNIVEIIMFPVFNLFAIYAFIVLLKYTKKNEIKLEITH